MAFKLPNVKKPCANCPFRKDCRKGWLGKNRSEGIAEQESFVCHKTVDYSEEDNQEQRKQCAGFMLMKKEESVFYRTAKIFGMYLGLKGEELVFESKQDFINHHSE